MKELKNIPKENPFKVPENYFEELDSRILAATTGRKNVPYGKGLVRKLLPYLAVAASFALLVILSYSVFYNNSGGRSKETVSSFTVNELTETLLNDIDLMTLEEKVAESNILNSRTGISQGDIIDYLVSENIDVIEIYENL
jgi:hypothetical protein